MTDMIVLDPPIRLKLAASTLLLSIPLVAVEVAVARHAPWWHLPWAPISYWAIGFFVVATPLSYGLVTCRRWAFPLLHVLLSLWVVSTLLLAWKDRPELGFFALVIAAFSTSLSMWLRIELARSFLDPRMSWYEDIPRRIPNLTCTWTHPESSITPLCHVSRLDLDGTFIFAPYNQLTQERPTLTKTAIPLNFEFKVSSQHEYKNDSKDVKRQTLTCTGHPVSLLPDGKGIGFLFSDMALDSKKQLGDFVEMLRGNGYV